MHVLHLLEHFPGACVRLEHVIGWIRHCYPHFPVVKPWKSYYETGFYNFCNFSKICNQNMSQGGTKNRFFRKTPRESTGKWLISSQLNFYQNRTKTHEIRANDLVGGEYTFPPHFGGPLSSYFNQPPPPCPSLKKVFTLPPMYKKY